VGTDDAMEGSKEKPLGIRGDLKREPDTMEPSAQREWENHITQGHRHKTLRKQNGRKARAGRRVRSQLGK